MTRAASVALAGCLFVYLTCELFPIGAQAELARGLGTSPGSVGLLVTWYAVVAGLATLPAVRLARSVDPRRVLVVAMVILAICQVGLATAGGLGSASAWRAATAVLHGVVWSQAPVVAARLAGPGTEGRATARVLAGASLGLLLGSPLAAFVVGLAGWRAGSTVLAVAAAVSAVALRVALPSLAAYDGPAAGPSTGSARTAWRPVLGVCALTAVVVTGHYVSYTFLQPLSVRAGLTGALTPVTLAVYGLAGLGGVLLVGRLLDRRPSQVTVATFVLLLAGLLLLLVPTVPAFAIALVAWGVAAGALPPVLNTAALRADPAHPETASAAYVVAYQVGISGGAALGAGVQAAASFGVLPLVSAGLVAACTAARVVLGGRRRVSTPAASP